MVENGYITVAEIAKRLKVSQNYIYRLVKEGKIPHVRIGTVVRFRPGDVDGWLKGTTK